MRILADIDNTIFAFSEHFEKWAIAAGYQIKPGVIHQTYSFQAMFDHEIDVEEFLHGFFTCPMTMATFPPLEHAVEPIRRLHDLGHTFVAVTACDPLEGLRERRIANIENVFGFQFEDVFLTGYHHPKTEVLARYDPSVWVEDNHRHARDGAKLGHETFLIDYPYNQGDGPYTRVKDWRAIEAHIINT